MKPNHIIPKRRNEPSNAQAADRRQRRIRDFDANGTTGTFAFRAIGLTGSD